MFLTDSVGIKFSSFLSVSPFECVIIACANLPEGFLATIVSIQEKTPPPPHPPLFFPHPFSFSHLLQPRHPLNLGGERPLSV